MNKRRAILLACIAAMAVVAAVYWFSSQEPSYAGKTLSDWVETLGERNRNPVRNDPVTNAAATAIQTIGTNAVPFLLDWMQWQDPTNLLSGLFYEIRKKWFPYSNTHEPVEVIRAEGAVEAFEVLGPKSSGAIPELTKLIHGPSENVGHKALWILAHSGPEAIPYLVNFIKRGYPTNLVSDAILWLSIQGTNALAIVPDLLPFLKSGNPQLVRHTSIVFYRIGANPSEILPILMSQLESTNEVLKVEIIRGLWRLGTNASVAVPALQKALSDTNWRIRAAATNALRAITPQMKYE